MDVDYVLSSTSRALTTKNASVTLYSIVISCNSWKNLLKIRKFWRKPKRKKNLTMTILWKLFPTLRKKLNPVNPSHIHTRQGQPILEIVGFLLLLFLLIRLGVHIDQFLWLTVTTSTWTWAISWIILPTIIRFLMPTLFLLNFIHMITIPSWTPLAIHLNLGWCREWALA